MSDPLISVVTPSVRPDGLAMVSRCLARQTESRWEWIVCSPQDVADRLRFSDPRARVIADPPRRPGDFYRLNGAFNRLVGAARCECLVFAVDHIWFENDTLERLLAAHRADPTVCVSCSGDHYRICPPWSDRPEVQWLTDARYGGEGPNGEMSPEWMELSLAMLPRSKIIEVGGFDENYDRVAGLSEKELGWRLYQAGCSMVFSPDVDHRIFTHAKSDSKKEWSTAYQKARTLFLKHAESFKAGTRKTIPAADTILQES